MDKTAIERAAAILVKARRDGEQLAGLPDALKPGSVADGHAIQDATTQLLGKLIAGYKAMNPPDAEANRGIIYGGTIHATPADLPAASVPQCGVEGEVAFIFRTAFPPRPTPYTRDEVAAGVEACAAIEIVSGRFAAGANVSNLEKLADSIINAGLVHDTPKPDWQRLDLGKLRVTLTVNGQVVMDKEGGHPTGDPLGVATALVNMRQAQGGVRAGQFVTCGSFTGLMYLKPGDVCAVTFAGLGSCRVEFTV